MTAQWRNRRRSQRGAIAILMAACTLAFFAFAGLVVDLGVARDLQRQSQTASDASALAAGNALYLEGERADVAAATEAARAFAAANYGVTDADWARCTDPGHLTVPPGGSPCISYHPDLEHPRTVRVTVPLRDVPTPFATLFGVDHVGVSAVAEASLDPGAPPACGLCVLGTDSLHDLQNGSVTVHGSGIHFNGDVDVGPTGLLKADGGPITVEGEASGRPLNYSPAALVGQPQMTDPLAGLGLPPDLTGLTVKTDPCGAGASHGPGIYGARNLRNLTCTLSPGLYVVAGDSRTSWDLAGSVASRLVGTGVTLYFTCGSPSAVRACADGEEGAFLDASGNSFLGIQAPTSGPLQGLAIVYDRNNAASLRLTGNGSANLTGTIYAALGQLRMNGDGCLTSYRSLIVVDDLELNGTLSCLQVSYDESQNWRLPPGGLHLSR